MPGERKPVIVITGASKGLGLAVTRILLEKFNAIVVTLSRSRTPELVELLKAHNDTLFTFEVDVTDQAAVADAIQLAVKTYHHIDGLILNAATLGQLGRIGTPGACTMDVWRALFDVNLFSLVHTIQATLPALKASELGGKIIFTSSGAAVGGMASWGPYSSSKAAMNSLCRTLASEEPEIICVSVRPGMVDTPMQAHIREIGAEHMREVDHARFVNAYTNGQLVKPEDAGHVIAALSIGASKELSGQFVSWDSDECKNFRNI